MSYNAKYINPLVQFGSVNLTLILEDDEGIMPPVRIDKKFREAEQITEEGLKAEADKEIARAIENYNLSLIPQEEQTNELQSD